MDKQPKPKQQDLPGMSERKIPDLHAAAESYAEGRDERMAHTKREVELKTRLLELMHKYKKTVYQFDDVKIEVVPEGEKVRVRIKKDGDADEE